MPVISPLRLFLPFAFGYFLSYLYRTVNGVAGPLLSHELGLADADLGLLTSTYFFLVLRNCRWAWRWIALAHVVLRLGYC